MSHHDSFHFEFLDDGGDGNPQEKCKKFDHFEIHMKKIEKPN